MNDQLETASARFRQLHKVEPALTIQAPGRVNLIGEHTDYNDGFVLPCAINFYTTIAASPRNDKRVRVFALDYDDAFDEFNIENELIFDETRMWPNYIRGVVSEMKSRQWPLGGADLVVTGNVPQGAGLSSSASLEIALAVTFRSLFAPHVSDQELALIGQAAENNFVGCNCGIMDQMISILGTESHAMLLDCRTLASEQVAMPDDLKVIIVNSNKQRGLVDSAYNERRQQCHLAAEHFGVSALRDVDEASLRSRLSRMDETVGRRARHVITENARTLKAKTALKRGDLAELGQLMAASHESMRQDFEITVPEIDYLVEIIKSGLGNEGGVRMTGGGFGGCVVALAPASKTETVSMIVRERYEAATGLAPAIFVCDAVDGAARLNPG